MKLYLQKLLVQLNLVLNKTEKNKINIGSAGGMTRLSTGYTFLNIQDHSKYITNNIEKIQKTKTYHIGKKYEFLDNIFLNIIFLIIKQIIFSLEWLLFYLYRHLPFSFHLLLLDLHL